MRDFRRNRLKPGEKSIWEQRGRPTEQDEPELPEAEEPIQPEEPEDEEKFKLIKGLMRHGLGRVFQKK